MKFNQAMRFENLYDSMWKCKRGKMKKISVAKFVLNGVKETLLLEEQIQKGKYHPRSPHEFKLTYPKERPCSSIHIRDRIVQRSLNDNILYPTMTNSFVWSNMACQKGKGSDAARNYLKKQLHRYYINNSNSNSGYILQCDVKGYYKHMKHKDADTCFRAKVDKATADACKSWLDYQYPGQQGYAPGSQMVQILGISLLDPFDHHAKEQLHADPYERYQDDFYIISSDKEYLERCKVELNKSLSQFGMWLHPQKTRIYPIKDGIPFLGFTFYLKNTGKVVMTLDPHNVKHERKKLFKMAQLVKKGEMTEAKFYKCYEAWLAHAKKGNSQHVIDRTNSYVKQLMEGVKNELSARSPSEGNNS